MNEDPPPLPPPLNPMSNIIIHKKFSPGLEEEEQILQGTVVDSQPTQPNLVLWQSPCIFSHTWER